MVLDLWLMFIFGIIIGMLLAALIVLRLPSGTIKIDTSNPYKDLYRLDFDNLDILPKSKYLLLKVDAHADLSHK